MFQFLRRKRPARSSLTSMPVHLTEAILRDMQMQLGQTLGRESPLPPSDDTPSAQLRRNVASFNMVDYPYFGKAHAWRLGNIDPAFSDGESSAISLPPDRINRGITLVGGDPSGNIARLFRHFCDTDVSLVFFDPTGQVYAALAHHLAATHRIETYCYDGRGYPQSVSFNPLAYMEPATRDTIPTELSTLGGLWLDLFKASVTPDPVLGLLEMDQYITATIDYLIKTEPQAPLVRLSELLNDPRLFAKLRGMDAAYRYLFTLSADTQNQSQQRLQALAQPFLLDPHLRRATQANTLDIPSYLHEPKALFVIGQDVANPSRYHPLNILLFHWLARISDAEPRPAPASYSSDDFDRDPAHYHNGVRFVFTDPTFVGGTTDIELFASFWPDTRHDLSFIMAAAQLDEIRTAFGKERDGNDVGDYCVKTFDTLIATQPLTVTDQEYVQRTYFVQPSDPFIQARTCLFTSSYPVIPLQWDA